MLTSKQLSDIEGLQKEVEAFDKIEMKLNWEMLRDRRSDGMDFLLYENNELIAFLGLYGFGSTCEATGMVKPGERRKGHFTRLFADAMASAKKIGFKNILLNAPGGSVAAKEFLEGQGAAYEFSEHQMQWEPQPLEDSEGFVLRRASFEDTDMRVRLDVEAFDRPLEDAIASESRTAEEKNTDMWMIDVGNETIGKIRVTKEEGQAWIYGFSVLPEHQGKGIGRKVLRRIVKQQSEKGHSVHLEVEAKNAHALRLYESVGFKVMHAQDYYGFER